MQKGTVTEGRTAGHHVMKEAKESWVGCEPKQHLPKTWVLQELTGEVVKIAVMNLQSDPLGVQGCPNRDAHVIWKLVTLSDRGRCGSKKGWKLGTGLIPDLPISRPSISPAIPVPNTGVPLDTYLPHHGTHCAPDSPAHDDL